MTTIENPFREFSENLQSEHREPSENLQSSSESLQSRIAFIILYIGICKVIVVQWFKKHGGDIVGGIVLILLLLGIGYTVKTYVIPLLPWMWSSSGSLLSWLWVSSWSVLSWLWSGFWSILSWLWSVSFWILLIFVAIVVLCIVIDNRETRQENKRLLGERMRRVRMKKAEKRANNIHQNRTKS